MIVVDFAHAGFDESGSVDFAVSRRFTAAFLLKVLREKIFNERIWTDADIRLFLYVLRAKSFFKWNGFFLFKDSLVNIFKRLTSWVSSNVSPH